MCGKTGGSISPSSAAICSIVWSLTSWPSTRSSGATPKITEPPPWFSMAQTALAASLRSFVVNLNSNVSDSPAATHGEIFSSVTELDPQLTIVAWLHGCNLGSRSCIAAIRSSCRRDACHGNRSEGRRWTGWRLGVRAGPAPDAGDARSGPMEARAAWPSPAQLRIVKRSGANAFPGSPRRFPKTQS